MKKFFLITILLLAPSFALASTNVAHSTIGVPGNNLGLVGYWPLDGDTTNWTTDTTSDMSGNGNTGTLVSMSTTTSPVAGKIGEALKFDGSSQYINVPYSTSLAPTVITMAAWFYDTNVSQNARIFSKTEAGGYNLAFNDGSLTGLTATVHTSSGYFYVNDAAVSNNTWYYAVVTYDGATLRLYVNGVDVSDTAVTGGAITYSHANPLCIGYEPSSTSCNGLGGSPGYFPGKLDDLRIYNRALSAQEIQQLYVNGGGVIDHSNTTSLSSGLVGYYPLDGNTTNWTTNKTSDMSGNGNTGTLVSMSTTTSPIGGKIGGALKFNGSSSYVVSSSMSGPLKNEGTYSFWIKPATASGRQNIISIGSASGGNGNWTRIYQNGTNISTDVYTSGSNVTTASSVVTANKWLHVVFVNSTSQDRNELYINGVLTATGTVFQDGSANHSYLEIGDDSGVSNTHFNGTIDDVRIYNRALSAQEVAQLYAQGSANIDHSNTTALSSGLVGYWPLDGNTTNWRTDTTTDSSGNGNTGTLNNFSTTTSPTAGKIGSALKFDGSSTWISAPDAPTLDPGTNSFTVSAWVYEKTCVAAMVIAAKSAGGSPSSTYGWHFAVFNAGSCNPQLHYATSGVFTTIANSNNLVPGKWYHVVAVVDRTNSANNLIYINGNSSGSSVSGFGSNTGAVTNTQPLAIGSESDTGFNWSGTIDDVRIYNRALSPQEVAQLYAMGK